jgi:tetratricopeptide (TPR) repeat protein
MEESRDLLIGQRARLEALGDCRVAGPYHFWLGHTYSHLGDYEGADSSARRAIEDGERCGDDKTIAKAHYVLAREGVWTGRFREGVEHGRKAAALLEQAGERWWLGHSHFWIGFNLFFQGEFDLALEAVARGRAVGEAVGDPRLQSYAAWNAAFYLATRGDAEAAINECVRSLELSPDPLNTAFATGWLGFSYREHGDFDRAITYLERAIASMHEYAYPRLVGWYQGWLSEAYLRNGDVERARELAREALDISVETRGDWAAGVAQRALGRIAHAAGDPREAEARLLEGLQVFASIEAWFDVAVTRLDLVEHARLQGRPDEAVAHLAEARAILDRLPAPRYRERAERLSEELGAHTAGGPITAAEGAANER